MDNYNLSHSGEQLDEAIGDVLNGNVEFSNNKVTSLSDSSTNTQYPSAKAVYDALQNMVNVVGKTLYINCNNE